MANTRYLTTEVEEYVRKSLQERFGTKFHKRVLDLMTGGHHEFDAVSDDGKIVASIKATSGKTASGKIPAGKFNNALAEIYYLSLVDAPTRLLVLTYPAFYEMLKVKTTGALALGVDLDCVILPDEMQREVDRVLAAASKEVSPIAAEAIVEAEI